MKYIPVDRAARPISYQQRVKETNIKRIFDLVRQGKCSSRAELVRAMHLSATSISVLVDELTALGMMDEIGPQQTFQPGRRPITLRFNAGARQIAVFSLSRAGVRYRLVNLACEVLEDLFVPFDASRLEGEESGERYTALFADILENRSEKFDAGRAALIGISVPGAYVEALHTVYMRISMGTCISEETLRRFCRRIGLPLYIASAAMCNAYAEKKHMDAVEPDAADTRYMLYVRVAEATIRGAIIGNGSLYTGPYNLPGEIGHFSIDYNGRPCPCGSAGCLERYVSLDAILADARQACARAGAPEPQSIEDLAASAPSVPAAAEALDRSAAMLASGLYTAMCGSGMRTVILGGGAHRLGADFLRRVHREIMRRSLFIHNLDLRYAQLDDDADCAGLVQYFLDKHFTITM